MTLAEAGARIDASFERRVMLVRPGQQMRPPVEIRWARDAVFRVFLALSALGWGLALPHARLLIDTQPVMEGEFPSHMVRSDAAGWWWAPILGMLIAAWLFLPERWVKTAPARIFAAGVATAATAAALVLLAWVAPVQAYREGTFYDYPSWGNISLTALVFITPGVIAFAAAVVLLSRSTLLPSRLRLGLLGAGAAAGISVLVALSVLGGFLEADQGHRGLEAIAQRTLLALAGVALIAMLARPGRRPAWLRGMVVIGSLLAVAAIVVAGPGLAAGAVCVFGSGVITEWVCGPAVIALACAEITFLVGWVLYARAQNRLQAGS